MRVCSECGHEWSATVSNDGDAAPESTVLGVKEAHGALLTNGDTVVLIKDLKLRGSLSAVKVGIRVQGIRLVEGDDHNIDCKIAGFGAIQLTPAFVKQA